VRCEAGGRGGEGAPVARRWSSQRALRMRRAADPARASASIAFAPCRRHLSDHPCGAGSRFCIRTTLQSSDSVHWAAEVLPPGAGVGLRQSVSRRPSAARRTVAWDHGKGAVRRRRLAAMPLRPWRIPAQRHSQQPFTGAPYAELAPLVRSSTRQNLAWAASSAAPHRALSVTRAAWLVHPPTGSRCVMSERSRRSAANSDLATRRRPLRLAEQGVESPDGALAAPGTFAVRTGSPSDVGASARIC
jgi:hypothetical protein